MKITDLEPYRPHIDEFGLTEEEKLELVNSIIEIGEVVLDRKFGHKDMLSSLISKTKTFPF